MKIINWSYKDVMKINRSMNNKILLYMFLLMAWSLVGQTAKSAKAEARTTAEQSSPALPEVKVEGFIEEKELYLEQNLHYVIRLTWKGEADALEIRRPRTPELEGLERLYTEQSTSVKPETEEAMIDFVFLLRPLQKGVVKIGAVDITYSEKGGGRPQTVTIPSIEATIIEPPKKTFPFKTIIRILITLVILGILTSIIWLIVIGRIRIPLFKRRWFMSEDEDEPSPYERLSAEAATLKMHLMNGDDKKFFDKLFLIVRNMISQRVQKDLDNTTDAEMIEMVKAISNDEYFSRKVSEMLEQCQKVRFGGYEPTTQESEIALKDLKDLIAYEDRRYKRQSKTQPEEGS